MDNRTQILLENELFRIVALLIERGDKNTKQDVTEEVYKFCKEYECDKTEAIDMLDNMMKSRKERVGHGPSGVKQYVRKERAKKSEPEER